MTKPLIPSLQIASLIFLGYVFIASHPTAVRTLSTFCLLIASSLFLQAEEVSDKTKLLAEIPSVADCIPDAISQAKKPTIRPFDKGLDMYVSTSIESTRLHTLQGLNHLHGGWEFEARRHFSAAITADPDCLIAHWGLVMTMLSPSAETQENRIAAKERLVYLYQKNKGTDIERGFANAIIRYINEGPEEAKLAFRQISNKFPKDLQSAIFTAIFSRGGYDDSGLVSPSQADAEKKLSKLVEENPDNILALHALLVIRAEAPDLRSSLEHARKLCDLVHDYPPYFHILGHYEWRCGEHVRAVSAFAKAAGLYSNWMKQNAITPADCPEWIRAESYRVVALASKGDFDNAIASAEKIAGTSLDSKRPNAPGTRVLLWDTRTLPARIIMRQGLPGYAAKAIKTLPSLEETESFRNHSLFYWWIDGLHITLHAQSLLEEKKQEQASKHLEAISFHGEKMAKLQSNASSNGEYHEWRRSFLALETITAELRGQIALAGPKNHQASAYNWFRAAADRQRPANMLNPPLILTPMASHIGDYYISVNKSHKALNAYQEALAKFPNDKSILNKIKIAEEQASAQPEKISEDKLPEEN